MARFCMFCGKEMPESAAFCPSCGAKQPIEEPTETPDVKAEEDDDKGESNAALDILSKANFSTKKQKGASGVIRVEAEKAELKKYSMKNLKIEQRNLKNRLKSLQLKDLMMEFLMLSLMTLNQKSICLMQQ